MKGSESSFFTSHFSVRGIVEVRSKNFRGKSVRWRNAVNGFAPVPSAWTELQAPGHRDVAAGDSSDTPALHPRSRINVTESRVVWESLDVSKKC